MSKMDIISKALDLPSIRDDSSPSTEVEPMPDNVKESLKRNKKELNEIYCNAKKLLLNLIDEVSDIPRARDVEVLTGFMRETTEILRRVRDIDKDIIDITGNGNGEDKKEKTVNNYLFAGDTRDLIHLVKELKDKAKMEENVVEIKKEN